MSSDNDTGEILIHLMFGRDVKESVIETSKAREESLPLGPSSL